ncbi:metallophosphoesterase family protein [Pygmaiobacter massiliensis]|uniref:metallophosphoesterase family protein n=1 Tax=Pygmaiobacter massiliensis TaxID=1917873 RepID=UPI002A803BA0|nr:metallophosphoesterase family protein [Pygmaiobacter massiliensis]MDY4784956.1 metallophosphoesterase family protein [Pygmaiobacter massiliensis]
MTGIISDIHGNYPALCAVLECLRKAHCTEILCLGDVAGYSCMVNECIDLLRQEKVISLKGNHDSYLLGEGECPRSRSVNQCIAYQKQIITKENYHWLEQTKPLRVTESYLAIHGGPHDFLDEYVTEFDFNDPFLAQYSSIHRFFTGHTHVPVLKQSGQNIYCNPGSVGQPRDYDPRASFALWDGTALTLHRTAYDIDAIARSMNQAGFSEYYYSNLYLGCKIGEKPLKGVT